MGGLLIIILFVLVIILLVRNNQLSDKISNMNKTDNNSNDINMVNTISTNTNTNTIKHCPGCGASLEEEDSSKTNFCPSCGMNLSNNSVPNTVQNNTPATVQNNASETVIKEKKTISDKSIKNSFILIAGALLIIISAITLLTSTWEYSHDIFKTIIISFMFLVFLGSSYIAKDKLKLKVVSKVFLYIALAYLPLIFLSISLFSLFGYYLSIDGEGRYIYLAISSILLSVIYFISMRKHNDILISIYGNIFQLLSIIFLSLIFTSNAFVVIFMLSIYTLIYSLFDIKNKYYYSLKIDKIILLIYTITLFVISLFVGLGNINIFYILSLIIDIFLVYFIVGKLFNKMNTYDWIYPLLIIIISLTIPRLFNNTIYLYLIFMLLGSLIIFILDYIRNKNVKILNYIYTSIVICSLYLIILFSCNALTISLFLLGYLLLSILYYIYLNNSKVMASWILPIVSLLIITHITYYFDISVIFVGIIFSIILIISSLMKIKDNVLKNTLSISSIVFMSIYYFIQVMKYLNAYTLIFSLYLTIMLFILFIIKKNSLYKLLSYIYLIISMLYLFVLYNIPINNLYVLYISLLLIFGIECIKLFKNKAGTIFIFILFIIDFLFIFSFDNNILLLIGLILLYELYLYINKLNIKYNYLPICSIGLFCLINSDIYSIIMSIIILSLLLLFTNINDNTRKDIPIMSYVFSGFIVLTDYNKYLKLILLILLFGYYLYLFKKDIFKVFLYLLITILLRNICLDIGIGHISLFSYGLYVILFVLCSIDVFRKHISWFKVLEYIGLILLYYIAMFNYYDVLDGLLFVCLILVLTIFGYLKKYGPIFIVSLIFVLINMFYLTRVFWLSIPWWIYLLVVGIILILFAIYNEMNEKKNRNLLKDLAKKLNL